jgi:hypothetical protein
VIEGVGGSQVWIKIPAYTPFPPPTAGQPIEALAAEHVYSVIVSAMKRQSDKARLDFRVKEDRGRNGMRLADIRLRSEGEQVCRWRIREVPRLFHASVVIDDLGQDLEPAHQLLKLPYPLTFSILPHLKYSVATASEVHRAGREVMLHLPMEPEPGSFLSPGEGQIRVGMDPGKMGWVLQSDLDSVPYATGANNHMGSRATTRPQLMTAVARVLAGRHLYFIDSRTTSASVALDVARQQGVPAFYRSVFLDDTRTVSYTLGKLREFRRTAEEQGAALAIGHPYPSTLAALARFLPELERADIQLVPASQLVHLPEVATLWPPHRPAP